MRCRIADLIVDVPELGDMAERCAPYRWDGGGKPDIEIFGGDLCPERWPGLAEEYLPYMETGDRFYTALLHFGGLMLHASAVALDGKAYLFSGPSGVGKSTHTRMWKQLFGDAVTVFNDDKPALRRIDGRWYGYGTPWCGKDGINVNLRVPLAGICFLQRGEENSIRKLAPSEALEELLSQTTYRLNRERMELLLRCLDRLTEDIPIFRLQNRPDEAAARISHETMREAGRGI